MNLQTMGLTATLKGQFMSTTNKMVVDYVGGKQAIYVGLAKPGTGSGTAKWQIKKITYDANGNITNISFAGGTLSFVNRWSLRASYTYS